MPRKKQPAYPSDAVLPPSMWSEFVAQTTDHSTESQHQWLETKNIHYFTAAKLRRAEIGVRLEPMIYKSILAAKGWTYRSLAARLSLSPERVNKHINNANRPVIWDDALFGLPYYHQTDKGHDTEPRQLYHLADQSSRARKPPKEKE